MKERIEISVGRDVSNDIVLNDPSVSLFHCTVSNETGGSVTISDLNSANGTWVNNKRVVRKNITLDDKIGIGNFEPDPADFFKKIIELTDKRRKDFSEEFQEILRVFTIYQRKKDKITDTPKTGLILRLVLGVGLILILVFFKDLIPDFQTRYIIIMSIGLLSFVSALFSAPQSKKNKMLDELRLEYEDKLVCPKCKSRLINHSLTYWQGKQQCPQPGCDAVYHK
ncbi:MAG TPA: FHA domain-containing protein [Saprospiraceae bacterium]|jgi:pSer/pThr/pTyr-binding forkhead associated (FHA) protein|nr:FHA domain-containing protein [Saprospiraceae bacterium]